jgi:hypothetical protein
MDFLATVKKKLEEMEEQARLLQAMEQSAQNPVLDRQGKALFQPRRGGAQAPQGQRQVTQPQRSMTSQEAFETPQCATLGSPAGAVLSTPGSPQLTPRLVDDLHGRLDEAFLLSEILGPPRCVRGWSDD